VFVDSLAQTEAQLARTAAPRGWSRRVPTCARPTRCWPGSSTTVQTPIPGR